MLIQWPRQFQYAKARILRLHLFGMRETLRRDMRYMAMGRIGQKRGIMHDGQQGPMRIGTAPR